MNNRNKVALVTGGTLGIGAATALALAKQGHDICLVARHIAGETLSAEIREMGVRCHVISADLSAVAACQAAVEETAAVLGGIDILVHSAGGPAPGGLLSGAADVWYAAFDIHLHAAFQLCRFAVPHMQANKEAAIIFISSAAGLRGVKNALAYSVVKGALFQLTRSLALELAPFNIRVNCVSPGVIRTRFQNSLTEAQVKKNLEDRIPLAREGRPSDVADVICMLVNNTFITGENVTIDGGMSMRIV
ncbi:SDR family NAD(P)-dependent oxidoreductase [Flavihumibacter fluvii]|uniref:SDR family NAD(P)-dependent oxidoreductase n=1 Tax=Flavihumibacter fluvii TaxID=2838157 RepID=UPI001BDF4EB2|nr:SDR family oxidoreductase [Flavihumibacter fluvii]ULQ51062.1 SDR family oxidoreductase [Flavihumibacter fluvii]